MALPVGLTLSSRLHPGFLQELFLGGFQFEPAEDEQGDYLQCSVSLYNMPSIGLQYKYLSNIPTKTLIGTPQTKTLSLQWEEGYADLSFNIEDTTWSSINQTFNTIVVTGANSPITGLIFFSISLSEGWNPSGSPFQFKLNQAQKPKIIFN
jgi:hypothetical protein